MKWFPFVRTYALALLILIVLVACSTGGESPVVPDDNSINRGTVSGTIALGSPEINGDILVVPIEFSNAIDLYSFSFRVIHDPSGLQPLSVEWSGFKEDGDATFEHLDQPDFIPFAFSRYSERAGLEGSGTLLHITYRILDINKASGSILTDPDFLVAYDSVGDLHTLEVGGDS